MKLELSLLLEKKPRLHMRTAKVLASLRIRTDSPEPMLFAHVRRGRPMGNFSQRTVASIMDRACAMKD